MTVTTTDPTRVAEERTGAPPVASVVPGTDGVGPAAAEDLIEEDLLVEDVSIDGMCGVY